MAVAAYALASAWYAAALAIARVCGPRRASARRASGRVVVVGTFHNPGWYRSHIVPLARAGVREVIVVSHGSLPQVDGVRLEAPPRWLTMLAGRALSKLVWTIDVGRRFDADVFIGYHIIPNATIALIAARLLRRAACYQMTGGPIELIGGGYLATENNVVGRLGRPSPSLERLALAVAGQFDLAVVRGRSAERFVGERCRPSRIAVIPGSIDLTQFTDGSGERPWDLIFVGRLAPTKQPLQFVEVVAAVREKVPGVRACIAGDGPMMTDVRGRIAALRLDDVVHVAGQVADASLYLRAARVFVLTSRSEGLSIAMAEAMACGAVPVVANVGDLGDLVMNESNGFLIEPGKIGQYAERAAELLLNPDRWNELSGRAAGSARRYQSIERVASLWREQLSAFGASCADAGSGAANDEAVPAALGALATRQESR
jgi:glycosyltransferase involved in cell wall biosynthesis